MYSCRFSRLRTPACFCISILLMALHCPWRSVLSSENPSVFSFPRSSRSKSAFRRSRRASPGVPSSAAACLPVSGLQCRTLLRASLLRTRFTRVSFPRRRSVFFQEVFFPQSSAAFTSGFLRTASDRARFTHLLNEKYPGKIRGIFVPKWLFFNNLGPFHPAER